MMFGWIIRVAFLALLSAVLLTSCGVTKKSTESRTETTSVSETNKDSTSTEAINRAIKDTVRVTVPVVDDVTDEKINQIMRQLQTSKSSGNNGYELYYNEKLRQLEARINVAETKDTNTTQNIETKTEKTFEQELNEYVKKIVIPWWMYLVAFVIFLPQIKSILSILFPVIRPFLNAIQNGAKTQNSETK